MIIYCVIWDSDAGTTLEHYQSEEARAEAIRADLLPHWDADEHGTAPDDWSDIWEKVTEWADFWLMTEEIDTNGTDTKGQQYTEQAT